MVPEKPHDLSKFDELNRLDQSARKDPKERKRIVERRMDLIREQFPSTTRLNWRKAFANDRDLFVRVWQDMLKLGQPQPGRPGPRPALEQKESFREFRALSGEDYSMEPFIATFKALADGLSFTTLARKLSMDRNYVYRLTAGTIEPDVYALREIAKTFKKDPSYFLEYRLHFVSAAMVQRMTETPESSVSLYRKLMAAT
jgi:hypothetical protein